MHVCSGASVGARAWTWACVHSHGCAGHQRVPEQRRNVRLGPLRCPALRPAFRVCLLNWAGLLLASGPDGLCHLCQGGPLSGPFLAPWTVQAPGPERCGVPRFQPLTREAPLDVSWGSVALTFSSNAVGSVIFKYSSPEPICSHPDLAQRSLPSSHSSC